jgi:engulfment/cell motility protein 1
MSSINNPGASRTTLAPSTTNGTRPKSSTGLIPTNNVTTKEGATVRARIDPTLTVDDVVRQLCVSLKVTDPSTHFTLRDRDTDELVTNENLRKKIKNKAHLKCVFFSLCDHDRWMLTDDASRLVNASIIEASEIIQKLNLRDERTLRLSLFSLQKFIKVPLSRPLA